MKRRTLLLALLVTDDASSLDSCLSVSPAHPHALLLPAAPGQRDRAPDHVVQPPVHPGAGHHHRPVGGNQHLQLEVQVHQPDGEAVEGQRQPGVGHRPLPGHAAADQVENEASRFSLRRLALASASRR